MTKGLIRVVFGSDEYLARQQIQILRNQAQREFPDADIFELDATDCEPYEFIEAVSPSLLSDVAIVILESAQNASDKLQDAVVEFCEESTKNSEMTSVLIAHHDGGMKARPLVNRMVKAGAEKIPIEDLKKPEARKNFVRRCFEQHGRRVETSAVELIAGVLGDNTGEMALLCDQLCSDFDDDPIPLKIVEVYMVANPQVTGFNVADKALSGNIAGAIVDMRNAVMQGTDPIAIIGALAMKLRMMAKASAVASGKISQTEAKAAPWQLDQARRQLRGWTSQGLGTCIQMLAWADEQSKTSGTDPVYALEKALEAIASRGQISTPKMNS